MATAIIMIIQNQWILYKINVSAALIIIGQLRRTWEYYYDDSNCCDHVNNTAIIFFILGFVCGKSSPKFRERMLNHKQKNDTKVETSQERDVEMMENVAYGPLHLRV